MADSDATVPPSTFYGRPPKTPKPGKTPAPVTPHHDRLSSTTPFTSTALENDPVFVQAAVEMKGKFVGPVSPEVFLDRYLPTSAATPAMPQVDYTAFQRVASQSKEPEMYQPLITALLPFCQGIELHNTSAVEDPDSGVFSGRRIKPDISCYKNECVPVADSCVTKAHLMSTLIEVKNNDEDEPFTLKKNEEFEVDTASARDTRGQLTVYANAMQALQYRTHTLTIFINRSRCRLMHWSKSCTVVTDAFDYTKENWLAMFFWRFSQADDTTRGVDPTFTPITTESPETTRARRAIDVLNTDPLFKVSVVDDDTNATSYYITDKLVLLKDTWRLRDYPKEGDTYRDVVGSSCVCGDMQDIWPRPLKHRVHVHYRLVLDTVGDRLTQFESTWEMAQAVYCAMVAHFEAATKARILHRDISAGNIIMVEGGGILIDWEFSKHLDEEGARGTRQFISIRLLLEDQIFHKIGDDLESFLYVLVWIAAKYAPNDMDIKFRTSLLRAFDLAGGVEKRNHILKGTSAIYDIKLEQPAFANLLVTLWLEFGARYNSDSYRFLETRDPEAAREWLNRLESHEWMMATLSEALKNEDWLSTTCDGRIKHLVIESEKTLTEGQKKPCIDTMKNTTRIGVVLLISLAFFAAEIAIGFKTKSLALIADAFHYLNDIVAYAIAFVAAYLHERGQHTNRFTYAFHRAELVGAFFNGVFLLALALSIFLQSIERFVHVEEVSTPKLVLIIGCIGLGLNVVSAIVIHDHHGHAHNPTFQAESLENEVNPQRDIINIPSFHTTHTALKSGRILLEASPIHLDLSKVKEDLLSIPDVLSVHDLHVWHLSQSVILGSLHVCVPLGTSLEQWERTERYLQHCFEEYGIKHVTISPEIHRDFQTLTQSSEELAGGCRLPSHDDFGCAVSGGDLKKRNVTRTTVIDAA
ncbi:hypothetical protein NLJ89_g4634 [Agrocybe chaxingu]|uniref:Non-specific serine/threonine protein kinase n=1 Tax=Agrocybe chaxingu TaxID=84603 RepID=A0A9W8K8H0_9AGAR|nr:hypothetical protein NLJ89_g4634 [Agrocybe chaxingu]